MYTTGSAAPGRLRFPHMGSAPRYCDSAMDRRRRRVVKRGALVTLAVLALAGSAVAAPPGKPPKPAGVPGAPPPAWIDAGAAEKWLAYSSYCWKNRCVDYISPEMRKDVPVLRIRRGQSVTLHLGFVPSQLSVSQGAKTRSLSGAQGGDVASGRRSRVDLRRAESRGRRELRRPHQGSLATGGRVVRSVWPLPSNKGVVMPRVVVTHAVEDLERWLQGKAERAAALEAGTGSNVTTTLPAMARTTSPSRRTSPTWTLWRAC